MEPSRPILGITGRTLGSSGGKTFRTKTVRRVVRRISNQACQWAYRLASGKHILGQKIIVDAERVVENSLHDRPQISRRLEVAPVTKVCFFQTRPVGDVAAALESTTDE